MILLGKIVLGVAGVALAGALCSGGFVHVNVIEKGGEGRHIEVIAPAMIAPLAIRVVPIAVRLASPTLDPDARCGLTQAESQLRARLPVIHAALAGLRDADDFTLVEVDAPGEHVQVAKSGASIIVDVNGPEAIVHVSAPIRALAGTINQLAAGANEPLNR